MKNLKYFYYLLISILFLTDSAFAAEDNILSLDRTLIIELLIFISAIYILNKFLFKPLLELDSRREKLTTGTISEARELKLKAEETVKLYKEQIDIARAQVQEERNETRKLAQSYATEMISRTRGEVGTMLDDARDNLEKESQVMREKIRPEVEIISRDIANRLMSREI